MGNSLNTHDTNNYDISPAVDDNEFDYNHNMENQFIVIDKVEKCQWKSITQWSEITSKDNKRGIKNRNNYFPNPII